jgi:multisubunit Na+/H+ antiporter MnhG subunit
MSGLLSAYKISMTITLIFLIFGIFSYLNNNHREFMNIKKAVLLIIVIVIALVYASPYITLYNLKNAADKNDTYKLETYIDFQTIKADFKTKMRSIISGGLEYSANENNDKSNTIGELGLLVANALVEPLVNKLVSPEIVAAVLRGEKPQNGINDEIVDPANSNSEIQLTTNIQTDEKKKRKVKIIPSYQSISTFKIRVADLSDTDSEVILLMKRDGVFSWKVYKAIIPALDKMADNINKKLSAINNTDNVATPDFVPNTPAKTNDEEKQPAAQNPAQEPFTQPTTNTSSQAQPTAQ